MRESQRLRRPTQECLGDNVGYRQYNIINYLKIIKIYDIIFM